VSGGRQQYLVAVNLLTANTNLGSCLIPELEMQRPLEMGTPALRLLQLLLLWATWVMHRTEHLQAAACNAPDVD